MTIQEAIKSGRPFRRKGWTAEYLIEVDAVGDIVNWLNQYDAAFTADDILADDWEVKDES